MIDDQVIAAQNPVPMRDQAMASEEREYAAASQVDTPDADVREDVLGHRLLGEFTQAELDRRQTELRWIRDLRNYRGQYDPETLALIGKSRSKVFVRKTRVKVKTVDSRVADLLFPAGDVKNWSLGPTPKPSLSPEQKSEIGQALVQLLGRAPTKPEFDKAVLESAKESAKAMAATVDDQLAEARYKEVCIKAIHSGHLYGTGIVKGPLVERRIRTRFIRQGKKWVPRTEAYVVPFLDFVPVWRFYPDMNATSLQQCRYVYERHTMTRHELAELARRKSFKGDVIREHIKTRPDGDMVLRYFDNEIRQIGERYTTQGAKAGQYEVLERWGYLSGEELKEAGVKVPEDRCHETFFSNVWLLPSGQVIKAVLQPINGVTWPYHLYSFDKDETSIFGEGLAAVMADEQAMINAATRMMLDNAALTSGPMLEVSVGLLSANEKVDEIHPWKVWLRNNVQPGSPAVRSITLDSRLGELAQMAAMFEQNADEVTAIPRYMGGENATNGAAGTSSGLSMLMGAVNIVIKDLITAWDEGVTISFIKALYHWNMQFNPDDSIKGDYDVMASGTASLVAKEVRSRQLTEFAAMTANPVDLPLVKRDKLLRQIAEANELTDVVKTEDELKAEQQNPMLQQQQQLQQALAQLQVAELKAKVADLESRAMQAQANVELTIAKAVAARVDAAFAAMQAAGVAVAQPHVAPAADEILKSSGWQDATPKTPISGIQPQPGAVPPQPGQQPQQPQPADPLSPEAILANAQQQPRGGAEGAMAGSQTPAMNDGGQA